MIEKSQNKKTKAEIAQEKREAEKQRKKVLQTRYGIGKKPQHFRGK